VDVVGAGTDDLARPAAVMGDADRADDVGAPVGDAGPHASAGAKADVGAALGGDGSGQEMARATMDSAVGDAGAVGGATDMTPSALLAQLRSTLPALNQSGECFVKTTLYPVTYHRLTGNLLNSTGG